MKNFTNQFSDAIFKELRLNRKDKILLTVSGGLDSITMLHLFMKAEISIAVAHCNFNLRGKESEEDEKFVAALCKKNKIPFYSEKFETSNYAAKIGASIQMTARELRYDWFEKLRKQIKFNYIATAHHQTDVVETMLINLLRKTGIAGLHGISAKQDKLIRPLLFATRNEILHFAHQNKIKYREDSSNESDDYLRNKIRHWLLPQLQKINPEFEAGFFESAAKIAQAEQVYQSAIREACTRIEKKSNTEITYAITELNKLNPRSIYLYEFLKAYNFTAAVCQDIENSFSHKPGSLFYSATHKLLIDRKSIIISKLSKKVSKKSYFIKQGQTEINKPIHLTLISQIKPPQFKPDNMTTLAQLDASKIKFPLELRKWKQGDTFVPLGMKGNKKVSDFFIDSKLSIFEKEKIWLLCSGNQIAWIVNHRIDDRFKITSSTKKMIRFEYLEK